MRFLRLMLVVLLPTSAFGADFSQPGNTAVLYWTLRDTFAGPLNYVHLVNVSATQDATVHLAVYRRESFARGCRSELDFFVCASREGGQVIDLTAIGPQGEPPVDLSPGSGLLVLTAYAVDDGLACGERPQSFTHIDGVLYAEMTQARLLTTAAGGTAAFHFGLGADGQPDLPEATLESSRFLTFDPRSLSAGSEFLMVGLQENAGALPGVNEIGPLDGAVCAGSRFSSNDEVPTSLTDLEVHCQLSFPLDYETQNAYCQGGFPECSPGFLSIDQGGQFIQDSYRVARGDESCAQASEPVGFSTFAAGWRFMVEEVFDRGARGFGTLTPFVPMLSNR